MLTLAAALVTQPQTTLEWFTAIFNIVLIDIVLAGDNAVVIALAVRNLPEKQRRMGILLGAGAAVALRAILTAVTAQLLTIPYLKLAGGLLILWIAIKLLRQNEAHHEANGEGAQGLWQAVWMILVADVTMSLDNVMAVGGAAGGNNALILFGLLLSIPLVVFGSNLVSKLMARFQIIVFIGAAILGKVGADMIMTDTVVAALLLPWWQSVTGATTLEAAVSSYEWLRHGVAAVFVIAIFSYGWSRRRKPKPTEPAAPAAP